MFNCDHCQKKYKRSWHQTRHNQMKHENSNTSTATSSTGTPPTPEINGNVNLPSANNNTYNYHQMPPQQQYQQPMVDDMSNLTTGGQQSVIPAQPNVWSPQLPTHQPHLNYGNEAMDTKNYVVPPSSSVPPVTTPAATAPNNLMNNGEYVHYAVNEQYSNKFDVQATPPITQQVSYDSWVSPKTKSTKKLCNFIIKNPLTESISTKSTTTFLGLFSTITTFITSSPSPPSSLSTAYRMVELL